MPVTFGTKAETLLKLKEYNFSIPDIHVFSVRDWCEDSPRVIDAIHRHFAPTRQRLAVRSSARIEDGGETSMAGAFDSVLDVDSSSPGEVSRAIGRVIASYRGDPSDQVLVQPMVKEIAVSGVIMTRCLEDGSPYYTINYDDESGKTDSVTGGVGASKTVFIYRGVRARDFDSPRVRQMVTLARNLEKVFGQVPLDIEFGLDLHGTMHLFQVRRICTTTGWRPQASRMVSKHIRLVEDFVRQHVRPRPGLHGSSTILGVMPDWNPAEIIGVTPRALATSLYREIVTRRVWSQAREEMGYRPMPPEELMVMVAGRPYIDVRASFNSFLPAGLSPETGRPLVEAWLDRLGAHPELHDKVEFEVACTVYDLDFDREFARRYPGLLAGDALQEYRDALLALTNACLDTGPAGTLGRSLEAVRTLERNQEQWRHDFSRMSAFETLSQVAALLEECRVLGTLPFSIVARHAFIAESLLRSAIRLGAISAARVAAFKQTVQTVSGRMSEDFRAVCRGGLARTEFLRRYGHLRPGTYDILSPSYAHRPELFEDPSLPQVEGETTVSFEPSGDERAAISALLRRNGLHATDADRLFHYARTAIAGREYAKFVFTRNLSEAIEGIAAWGRHLELNREDLSYIPVREILSCLQASPGDDPRTHFASLAASGRRSHDVARSFRLSYLIRSPRDVYIVPQHRCAPNFITAKRVEARVATLDAQSSAAPLQGRIVCIENADPGFDWVFAKGIAGLVTKYGGANSHMAIRCAEYDLPAAIGCGEMLYEKTSQAESCEINAGQKILRPVGTVDFDA